MCCINAFCLSREKEVQMVQHTETVFQEERREERGCVSAFPPLVAAVCAWLLSVMRVELHHSCCAPWSWSSLLPPPDAAVHVLLLRSLSHPPNRLCCCSVCLWFSSSHHTAVMKGLPECAASLPEAVCLPRKQRDFMSETLFSLYMLLLPWPCEIVYWTNNSIFVALVWSAAEKSSDSASSIFPWPWDVVAWHNIMKFDRDENLCSNRNTHERQERKVTEQTGVSLTLFLLWPLFLFEMRR